MTAGIGQIECNLNFIVYLTYLTLGYCFSEYLNLQRFEEIIYIYIYIYIRGLEL